MRVSNAYLFVFKENNIQIENTNLYYWNEKKCHLDNILFINLVSKL